MAIWTKVIFRFIFPSHEHKKQWFFFISLKLKQLPPTFIKKTSKFTKTPNFHINKKAVVNFQPFAAMYLQPLESFSRLQNKIVSEKVRHNFSLEFSSEFSLLISNYENVLCFVEQHHRSWRIFDLVWSFRVHINVIKRKKKKK